MLTSPHTLLFLSLTLCASVTACDQTDQFEPEADSSWRTETIGNRAQLTLNTNQWVSPGARDIYEFSVGGQWRLNSYGYETKLDTISLAASPYGPISSPVGPPPPPGVAHATIVPGDDFAIEVHGPLPGDPVHQLGGADLVGLGLSFTVRGAGSSDHPVLIEVVDHNEVPGAGDFYALHKMDPVTGESLAPLCEEDGDDNKHARFYDGLSVNAQTGVMTFVGQGVRHIGCTASAPGKAVEYGYGPAQVDVNAFTLANRIIRADYCADGYPYTYPGNLVAMEDNFSAGQEGKTLADVYAGLGVDEAVEAAWDEHGVLCVDTPRATNVEAIDLVCPIKHFADGTTAYNWKPPSCQGFVDPNPNGETRIYSRTAL